VDKNYISSVRLRHSDSSSHAMKRGVRNSCLPKSIRPLSIGSFDSSPTGGEFGMGAEIDFH